MVLDVSLAREIKLDLDAIENDHTLFDQSNFIGRADALDRLEFYILNQIQIARVRRPAQDLNLKDRAERIRDRLEKINARLFRKLRAQIKSGALVGAKLKRELEKYGGDRDGSGKYDALDALVGSLLRLNTPPPEIQSRDPEMVFYQPTPAQIILELVEKMPITPDAMFYDLGSGLGHICILVNLLTGVRTRGVEREPGYCDYARRCARRLNLSRVEFINADARTADYSDGTIFFMYTPFRGRLLAEVLRKLERASNQRAVRLYAYGPCVLDLNVQTWLRRVDPNLNSQHPLAIFETTRGNDQEEK